MLHRMLAALFAVMLALWAGLAIAGPASAETVFPLGLRIGLEPQGDLKPSKRFPGFEDPDRQAIITILDLPGRAYEEIERSAFSKNQPEMAGMKRESFPFASGIGFLVSGQVQISGVTLHKWFLLAGPVGGEVRDLTMLINVEVPDAAIAVYSDAVIRKVLASATFRQPPIEEQLALLPFKLSDLAGFQVMQAMAGGGVILTDGPSDDINKQPYMIVSVGNGAPTDPSERAKFSRDLLSSAPLRDIGITQAEQMRIGGLQGYEVRAQARGMNGEPVNVVQWMRFGAGGFMRIIGVSNKTKWDELFTRFRAVRDGIEMR